MSKSGQDWKSIVNGWTASRPGRVNVRSLVHTSMRMEQGDIDRIQSEIFREKRQAYEDELTEQAQAVGCKGVGTADGKTLREMHKESKEESVGIANTYNYDLARYIDKVRAAHFRANRTTYIKALKAWNEDRADWKNVMISLVNRVTWRSRAAADFMKMNSLNGMAQLMPSTHAVCDTCKYWIGRGKVAMSSVLSVIEGWPPHPNCVHTWKLTIDKQGLRCEDLWIGEEPRNRDRKKEVVLNEA